MTTIPAEYISKEEAIALKVNYINQKTNFDRCFNKCNAPATIFIKVDCGRSSNNTSMILALSFCDDFCLWCYVNTVNNPKSGSTPVRVDSSLLNVTNMTFSYVQSTDIDKSLLVINSGGCKITDKGVLSKCDFCEKDFSQKDVKTYLVLSSPSSPKKFVHSAFCDENCANCSYLKKLG